MGTRSVVALWHCLLRFVASSLSPSAVVGLPIPLICRPLNFRRLNLDSYCVHSTNNESSSIQEDVNELCRILSDFRGPHHDLESALTPFQSKLSTNLVEQVLKRCKYLGFSAHRFFLWAQQVHGFPHSELSYRILIDVLGSNKQFPLLWDFLWQMRETESCEITPQIFWIIFRAYSRAGLPADAIRAFYKMGDFNLNPDTDDLDQILYSLCKRKHMSYAEQLFDKTKTNLQPSVKTYSILMNGWGDAGDSGKARELFDEMRERGFLVDLLAYNSLLKSLASGGDIAEACKLFEEMRVNGFHPDAYSYSIFIHAYCKEGNLHCVFRFLDRMNRYGLLPNVYTYNHIIKTLCKNGDIEGAYTLLDEMIMKGVMPDVWSYNAIEAYHCENLEVNKAVWLISRMYRDGCQPDRHTYNMALKMLIRVGRFDRVEGVWKAMEKRGFYPSVSTYAVMVHGLCRKKRKEEDACRYFEWMIEEGIPPYVCTVEVLRNRLRLVGLKSHAEVLANKMDQSSSCCIRELSSVMRSTSVHITSKKNEDFSDVDGEH